MPLEYTSTRSRRPHRRRADAFLAGRLLRAALFAALLAGCALNGQNLKGPGPLESEGELYIELQPLAPEAARLDFEIGAISARRADGTFVPLTPAPGKIAAAGQRQRLLASGRLEPGSYSGLLLRIARATLAGASGSADLLLPPEPSPIEFAFTVAGHRATVLSLELNGPGSIDKGFAFAPSFTVSVPPRTVTPLIGYCADTGTHDLRVFDKRARAVTAVLPTGKAPWGLALDPLRNRAYVALADEDLILIIDVASGDEIGRIRLSAGDSPRELALTPDGRLLLSANAGSNTASFLDTGSMIELGRVPAGEEPLSLLLDRSGKRAFAFSARSSSVTVLDLAMRAAIATVAVEAQPLRGQLDRAGTRLYVASATSAYLTVFSLPGLAVLKRVFVGLGVTALKVDPATDLVYVALRGEKRLAVYDPFSLIPVDYLDVPGAPSYLSIDDAQNALFLLLPESREVAVFDLTTKRILARFDVGSEAHVLALMGERF